MARKHQSCMILVHPCQRYITMIQRRAELLGLVEREHVVESA